MHEVTASIVTIGDELLIGQTIDTNSAFIAQELNKIGVWVRRRVAIADDKKAILTTLKEEAGQSKIIIITGGLGPTADDITKPALCEYFGTELIRDEGATKNVETIFQKLGRPLTERNLSQGLVPATCEVLPNRRGTAPGMYWPPQSPKGEVSAAQPSLNADALHVPTTLNKEDRDHHTADPTTHGLLVRFAKNNRGNPTLAEDILWHQLRAHQLAEYKFRRRHIIGNYIADFVCLPSKLVVEIDGLHHQLPENASSDADRTFWLQSKGFKVLRFANAEVINNTEAVLQTIFQTLQQAPEAVGLSQSEPCAIESPSLEGLGEAAYFSLPGVPHEMKGLMHSGVLPKIKASFSLPVVAHRTLLTAGIGESFLADTIQAFETALPPAIKLAYLPAYGMVRLRLTARGDNDATVQEEVGKRFEELKGLVKEWLVAGEDIPLQQAVIKLLKERGKTLATAESCTGGSIAGLLTTVAGSSAVFNGGVVSYSNEAKKDLLGVKAETLQSFGAVSEDTVKEMAVGACQRLKTDYALATSGIMGPDGGTAEKPVGTVWIAVTDKEGTVQAQKFSFRFDRGRNTELTAHAALNMLRKYVLSRG